MFEVREILPRPARVAKHGRCAEGPSVKTMLAARGSSEQRANSITQLLKDRMIRSREMQFE